MRFKSIVKLIGISVVLFMMVGGGGGSSSSGGGDNPPAENPIPPVESNVYIDYDSHLIWQDDIDASTTKKPWLEGDNFSICVHDLFSEYCQDTSGNTAATYCSELTLNGYANWRLPTKKEFKYLYDKGEDSNLEYSSDSTYWTSEELINQNHLAYTYYSDERHIGNQRKSVKLYVRCVRDM